MNHTSSKVLTGMNEMNAETDNIHITFAFVGIYPNSLSFTNLSVGIDISQLIQDDNTSRILNDYYCLIALYLPPLYDLLLIILYHIFMVFARSPMQFISPL